MIRFVEFLRFRGFERLRADLEPHAFIVGPNSAGKSTVLEAIGLAEQCLRMARRQSHISMVFHNGRRLRGFPLPTNIDNEDDPVRYEFGKEETRVSVRWSSGGSMHMVWPEETEDRERGFFYLEDDDGAQPKTGPGIRMLFSPITIIPVITPLDSVEELKNPAYVEAHRSTRLASRHFRNHVWLMSKTDQWIAFKEFCQIWVPEIQLLEVSLNAGVNRLAVFYSEIGSRVPKELAWAGDGIQIWVQLLWHLFRATNTVTIVLDEPEVYLHPDLQRRLVRLLDGLPAQIILASHSADVIAEAPADGILWVDRRLAGAKRIKSQQSLSNLSASLGSSYNLALARSMRARLVIASDSEDLRIIRLLAKQVGANRIANEQTVGIVHLREVSNWAATNHLGESLRDVLPPKLPAVVLLQAGFRPQSLNRKILENLTAPGVTVAVWTRTELENYLLDVDTIARVSGASPDAVALHLTEACSQLRAVSRAVFTSTWVGGALEGSAKEVLLQAEQTFDELWSERARQVEIVRGTQLIREINVWLERDGYRLISGYSLAKAIRPQSLAAEVLNVLLGIDDLLQ